MADDAATVAGPFELDTAVRRESGENAAAAEAAGGGNAGTGEAAASVFAATVSPDWRAGRGPHGGYLAAMLLRALIDTVADARRSPRSLTIHYARAPSPGPLVIRTVLEREGRSLSTLSARMEQDGRVTALALAAFSVPWSGPEMSELPMPAVAPPDEERRPGALLAHGAPGFTRHIVLQPRIGGRPFVASEQPMELGCWIGLAEARALDAPALAFYTDALVPAPFMRLEQPSAAPTIDLTIHFRTPLPRAADPDPHEMCFVRVRGGVIHEGFFEEDTVIWAADGTVLAQSRQLALLMPANSPA